MNRWSFLILVLIIGSFLIRNGTLSCARKLPDLQVGSFYSVDDGKGSYKVVKVLVIEPGVVHIRLYANTFASRPGKIDTTQLTLGSIENKEAGIGIGHLPLSSKGFTNWEPKFILPGTVNSEELDGYEEWKKAGGGIWN